MGANNPSLLLRPRLVAVANRNSNPGVGLDSNGTDTGVNTRMRHTSPVSASILDIALSYTGWHMEPGETDNAVAITIRAAIEYPSGTYHPVFFRGARDVVIDPGCPRIDSDPLSVRIPANTNFWTRTYARVDSGVWPTGRVMVTTGSVLDAVESSATPTDKTTTGTITGTGNGFGPALVLGSLQSTARLASVACLGDSHVVGSNDTVSTTTGLSGWVERALGNAIPWNNIARGSNQTHWLANVARRRTLTLLGDWPTHVIYALGTSDFYGGKAGSALISEAQTVYGYLTPRYKVIAVTLSPITTSTDAWATTVNQTPADVGEEANRVQFNDWLRANGVAQGLVGYFDFADFVEPSRNAGIWKAGYTADGIHATATIYGTLATAFNATGLIQL